MFPFYILLFVFFMDAGMSSFILKNPKFAEVNPLVAKVIGSTNPVIGTFLPKLLAGAVIGGCWWMNQRYYKLDLDYLWYALSAFYVWLNYRNYTIYKKGVDNPS